MSETILPMLPIPTSQLPEDASLTTGEGSQSALAAMIRKRKMGENHVEEQSVAGDFAPKESPAAND